MNYYSQTVRNFRILGAALASILSKNTIQATEIDASFEAAFRNYCHHCSAQGVPPAERADALALFQDGLSIYLAYATNIETVRSTTHDR